MTLLLRGFYFNWALLDTLASRKTKAFYKSVILKLKLYSKYTYEKII